MTREEFLGRLSGLLAGLPAEERERTLAYYAEIIDDAMEEGIDEATAMARLGPPEDIAEKLLGRQDAGQASGGDTPPRESAASPPPPPPRRSGWVTLLAILGFPLWLPLLAAVFCLCIAAYILIWIPALALVCVFLGLCAGALAALTAGAGLLALSPPLGLAYIGGSLLSAGLAILAFLAIIQICKGLGRLTAALSRKLFGRRKVVQD